MKLEVVKSCVVSGSKQALEVKEKANRILSILQRNLALCIPAVKNGLGRADHRVCDNSLVTTYAERYSVYRSCSAPRVSFTTTQPLQIVILAVCYQLKQLKKQSEIVNIIGMPRSRESRR